MIWWMLGCALYRSYPLLDVQADDPNFTPTGLALLADGTMVVSAPGAANVLWEPVDSAAALGLPLRDARLQCPECRRPPWRAATRLAPQPVRWLPRDGREISPFDIEDLAPFGGSQVLGITAYSTVGRRTGYRKDNTALPRQEAERIFVLERMAEVGGGGWEERLVPEVDRFRDALSDWGRARCEGDMRVQGLAFDPVSGTAFVGLRRCAGPVARVLSYDLGAARAGGAVDLVTYADDVLGGRGAEEGVTGLCWQGGLWAITGWDGYGYEHEPAWGGRLHRIGDGTLVPEGPRFVDRPSALAVPEPTPGGEADAFVLFDDDNRAGAPIATFVAAPLPRPADEAWVGLAELRDLGVGQPLGLNGFDVRWYARDHRLGQFDVVLDRREDGAPGAWSRAVGGLWQMQVGGTLGLWFAPFSNVVGHSRQAVALTDWSGTDLQFHAFRAELSVIPRDRERQNPSVARLLDTLADAYTVTATLPVPASPGAGLVLQGFEMDTSARADRGICVAAINLGVAWHDETHAAVDLRAMLIGGLCNDFDTRGEGLRHGKTTDSSGGVTIALRFAVVEGGQAVRWENRVADLDLPAPRGPQGYVRAPESVTTDAVAREHLHCVRLADEADLGPGDPSWRRLDTQIGGADIGALSGFTLALDKLGFDPAVAQTPMSEGQALNRNAYIHQYLLRSFGGPAGVLEGGITHGIHRTGFMRDNQTPSALLVSAEMTGFGVAGQPFDMLADPRRDPNVQPEDGYVRWAVGLPPSTEAQCSSSR